MTALSRYRNGELSGPMTVLELVCETEDVERTRAIIASACDDARSPAAKEKLQALDDLVGDHIEGCRAIVRMLRDGKDTAERFDDPARGVAFARDLFDSSVVVDDVLSVAMWSLGDRAILNEAQTHVVTWLRHSVVGKSDRILDFGCGTGRYTIALAPFAAHVTGLDVSTRMIEVAGERAPQSDVSWVVGSGRLLPFVDESFDVVVAIDSFPYVHQGGDVLLDEVTREMRRVLRPKGRLAILNLAYGDDAARDTDVIESIARTHGFVVTVRAARPSSIWTVPAWVLTR